MNSKDVLVGAKNYLIQNGWYQGAYQSPISNAVSLETALSRVYGDSGMYETGAFTTWGLFKAQNILRNVIEYYDIDGWNDDPDRREYEVLYALDYAARMAGGK